MLERVLEPEVMDTVEEAQGYDGMDHAEPNEAFVDRLLELGASGKMLDIGTGPGQIPLLLARKSPGAQILGVDLSQHMLAVAERHRLASEQAPQVEFRIADAKDLPFRDASYDVVFSNTILHHIPNPRPFLREAWRVLRPSGVFLIRDLFRPTSVEQLDHLVAEHAADANDYQRALFRASLHAAFTIDELSALAGEVGIDGAEVVQDSDRHMSLQGRKPG